MARKRRPFNLKSRITSALRRIWFYSPQRRLVSAKSKVTMLCEKCEEKVPKLDIDHVREVVPITGFDDWNGYIKRLFEGDLMAICKPCHNNKTQAANKARRAYAKKVVKKRRKR